MSTKLNRRRSDSFDRMMEALEQRQLLTAYTAVPLTEFYGIPAEEPPSTGALSAAEGFSPGRTYAYSNAGGDNAYVMTNGSVFLRSELPGLDQVPGGTVRITAVSDQGVVAGLSRQALAGTTSNPFLLDLANPDEPRFLSDVIKHVDGPSVNIDWLRIMDFEPDGDALVEGGSNVYVLSGDTLTFLRGGAVNRIPGTDDAGRVLTVHVTTSSFTDRGGTDIVTQAQAELLDLDGIRSAVVELAGDPAEGHYGLNPGHTRPLTVGPPISAISDSIVMLPDGHILTGTHALTPVDEAVPYKSGGALHSARFGDSPYVVSVNSARMAVGMIQSADGRWTTVGYPELDGAATLDTYTDPNDGGIYIIAFGDLTLAEGANADAAIYRVRADGTLEAPAVVMSGVPVIAAKLTVFASVDGRVHAVGLDSSNQIMMFYQTGERDSNDVAVWSYDNISVNHLAPAGFSSPEWLPDSEFTAYVAPWNGLNVAGLDTQGNIRVIWWAPGKVFWSSNNISFDIGLGSVVGPITSYVTPWGGLNIAGLDGNGDLHVLWWVPGFEQWRHDNVTAEVAGAKLTTVSAYVNAWGGLNIAGSDKATGRPVVYWWTPGMVDWISEAVEVEGSGEQTPWPTGQAAMVPVIIGTQQNLVGASEDREVVRMFWSPGDTEWRLENLSVLAV